MVGRIQRDSIHHTDWATTEQHHKDATMLGYDMQFKTFATSLWTTAGLFMAGAMASAQEVNQELEIVGRPVDGGTGFQPAATELARDVQWLDGMLLVIITAISLFVLPCCAVAIASSTEPTTSAPSLSHCSRRVRTM